MWRSCIDCTNKTSIGHKRINFVKFGHCLHCFEWTSHQISFREPFCGTYFSSFQDGFGSVFFRSSVLLDTEFIDSEIQLICSFEFKITAKPTWKINHHVMLPLIKIVSSISLIFIANNFNIIHQIKQKINGKSAICLHRLHQHQHRHRNPHRHRHRHRRKFWKNYVKRLPGFNWTKQNNFFLGENERKNWKYESNKWKKTSVTLNNKMIFISWLIVTKKEIIKRKYICILRDQR